MKDGKFDVEGSRNVAKMHFNLNDEQLAKIEEIYTACSSTTDSDKCEMAYKGMNCVHEWEVQMGINFFF